MRLPVGLVLEIYSHTANDFVKGIKRRGAVWRRVGFRRRSVANDLAIGMLINEIDVRTSGLYLLHHARLPEVDAGFHRLAGV